MQVASFDILDGTSEDEFRNIMANIEGCEQSLNNTSQALVDFFGKDVSDKNIINQIPFSSARKYSAVAIEGIGGFSIGAPHFVPCPVSQKMDEMIADYAAEGKRVLLVARHENIENEGAPLALIAINDRIRESAAETIHKFQEQGVRVKVISGDHAETVSTIARKVGIIDADKYLSCDSISDTEPTTISVPEKRSTNPTSAPDDFIERSAAIIAYSLGHIVTMPIADVLE
jgi:cation-transporting ATPase E